eukprot:CAMPEP_0196678214 /NCGR_PEP_ID=MMETSP1090-20130531/6184_1 /TAXON_ID=37098 /ORGANISM="Isochrysis sp, Strain CCMP1244" /LENGTH=118 /DNA_ID=CAMNT_0042016345 /DNA_START=633 /DNA_END=989 /DNA_ORIENTATION=-
MVQIEKASMAGEPRSGVCRSAHRWLHARASVPSPQPALQRLQPLQAVSARQRASCAPQCSTTHALCEAARGSCEARSRSERGGTGEGMPTQAGADGLDAKKAATRRVAERLSEPSAAR